MTLEAFLSVQMGRVKSAAAEIQQREAKRQPADLTKAVPEALEGWPVHFPFNSTKQSARWRQLSERSMR